MLVINIENLNREYEIINMVMGSCILSKHLGKDIIAGLKLITIGGELKGYTEMLNESRNIAISRMVKQAEELKADAIIGVRFNSSTITSGAAEYLVYGTAVKYI